MAQGHKITLAEARKSSAVGITIYCEAAPAAAGGCRHVGAIAIDEAIERWGEGRRLDELPLVCSQCGGRCVDVRPLFDNALDASSRSRASGLLDAWRARPPGARWR
jgi:hypothetical protein